MTDWQENQAKQFAHSVAESVLKQRAHASESQLFWLGVIAIVTLSSARLWIGSMAVFLILILILIWRSRIGRESLFWRLDRFRDAFRRLLNRSILSEDKDYLRSIHDRVLFLFAVADESYKRITAVDLWQIETL